jgi:O-methyltransferase involved in polyketide biosynthesis
MSEKKSHLLSGVPETMLVTLYLRAMETQRPDALIKDEKAVELVARLDYDFARVRQIPLSESNKLVMVLRYREFDRYTRDFLARSPEAVVVHIGCGLDSRFERVDNGRVEWYDLDLPEVIQLRRKYIGGEGDRYHLLSYSVLEDAWLEALSAYSQRPFLFLAEGVFMYFEAAQVKSLVLKLCDHFPGAELVFESYSPLHLRLSNLQMSTLGHHAPARWGIWRGQELEGWGAGIHLLDEWGFFDRPEPRLVHIRWMRPIESLLRTLRIYHFQLGYAAG